jgi:hypothetical protein
MPALATSLDAPPSGRKVPVWFDFTAYCREKLLDGGPIPWTAPGELSAFFGKAQGMFHSDALLVDVADLYASRIRQDPSLPAAMAARTRPGFALRTLLADEGARATARQAMSALGAADSATPVVVSMPSPARWLALAARQAGTPAEMPPDMLSDPPPEARHVEAAAIYVADLLRIFADARVDGLVLDEGSAAPAALLDFESYRPVLNVAGHYEWPVWIRTDAAPCWPQGSIEGVAGWFGQRAPDDAGEPWGVVLAIDPGSADSLRATAGGAAVLAVVGADADPDAVMGWVRGLP